ncbi:MAG: 4-hydroxybenzoate octaprenyltransferase [Alphaproteobacteria bacterium]|nr:4-hydroxybenzoate octaprenyltransferase [Alphaproteobacteria bacterium]
MFSPPKLKASLRLARLHRPVGILLLLCPAWWGISLASQGFPEPFLLFLFACGAIFMRSAGCVYNDIIDQDFDRQVKRTSLRPLAARELLTQDAYLVLLVFLLGGALILSCLPLPTILTGFLALGLVLLYPWMKRVTYWPQFFLGITFNIGIIMGWFSLQPVMSLTPILFYGGAILWTLGYDTVYALQDIEDDLRIGVKSSAIAVYANPKFFLAFVYGGALFLWCFGGVLAHLSWIFWIFVGMIALHFTWQILSLDQKSSSNCLRRFESNVNIGFLLFLGIVFSNLID